MANVFWAKVLIRRCFHPFTLSTPVELGSTHFDRAVGDDLETDVMERNDAATIMAKLEELERLQKEAWSTMKTAIPGLRSGMQKVEAWIAEVAVTQARHCSAIAVIQP